MATTNIEWTDRVWNPVTGCTKVSAGCKNCYAEKVADRFWASQYPPVEYQEYSVDNCCPVTEMRARRFTDVQTHEDRLLEPLRWRKPSRVFVNSMSDLFHEDVPDAFIDRVVAVMALASRHTFQVLTKRPARMLAYLTKSGRRSNVEWARTDVQQHVEAYWSKAELSTAYAKPDAEWDRVYRAWPISNVWLGVSVEDQQRYDQRIGHLLRTPTAVRFLSYEPALGPLDLRMGGMSMPDYSPYDPLPTIDWLIAGAESGRGARGMDEDWVRSVRNQCHAAGIAFFYKQKLDERGRKVGLPMLDERRHARYPAMDGGKRGVACG